jgi:hypothetical protein
MHRWIISFTLALAAPSVLCASGTPFVVPTTTLSEQTANNTSAASGFALQSNNNRGAGPTSKVNIHSLLYAGATTKVYAHMVLWFGQSNHMNVGYSETNQAQVQSQIDDMVSRGIDGVIVDWYGQNNSIDQATQYVMAAAAAHPGFSFAIMIDQGAIEWDSCQGCSPQQALVSDLQYLEQTYFPSPAYLTIGGQPVVTNFNVSLSYPSVDWTSAGDSLGTHPAFWFQNNSGFTQPLSGGSYSWVMPTTTDYGMNYLSSFYDLGETFPSEQTVGAGYKGFNDTLASWGSNRIMNQQCGQTWLSTFAAISSVYNSGQQLSDLQLVTWNDYEEGTEIESGIDNCVTVSASSAANTLQWAVNGNENTVDHYTVYISTDGQTLMPLADAATGIYSLDVCQFSVPNGNYQLFVQAVGQPSIATRMSNAVSYAARCVPPASAPSISFSASPETVTVSSGATGTFTVVATPQSGSFNQPITLTCGSISAKLSCSFSPAVITPGAGPASSTLIISTAAASADVDRQHTNQRKPIGGSWLLAFAVTAFVFTGGWKKQRGIHSLAICGLIGLGMAGASCGGTDRMAAAQVAATAAPISYSVAVNGSAGATQLSTTVTIVVQ